MSRLFFPIFLPCYLCFALFGEGQTPAPSPSPSPPAKSLVYCMSNESAITDFQEDPAAVRRMVDYVVMATTGRGDVPSAWRSLVKPGDKVGIKISTAGGKFFSTHKAVVDAIIDGLESAGIPRDSVIVWDRDGLAAAGYKNRPGGYQVESIAPVRGYDPAAIITSAALGKLIWGDLDFARRDPHQHGIVPEEKEQLSPDSHLCYIMSREVNKVINVPVLSSAESCGIAGCLYNITVPNVDNWRRYSDNDSFISDIYTDDRVGKKVVINIMDGLIAQYAGGPDFQPNYAINHHMIYASKDPVALDAVALGEIEKCRVQAKLPRIAPHAAYLLTAEDMGIGAATPDRIGLLLVQPE